MLTSLSSVRKSVPSCTSPNTLFMNTSSSGRKTPVDHGVQIRFINDLCDTGGAQPGPQPKTRPQTSSKYGVAVRVQGIAGQPYVVLKDGQKGDSYGVQLKTNYPSGYSSLPRRREKVEPGTGGADGGGSGGEVGNLRRAQSHGSLLDRDGEGGAGKEDFQLSRPPGDGKSGSYGNLDGGIGVRGERVHVSVREGDMDRNMWDSSCTATTEHSSHQRQTPVNRLIDRFDGGSTEAQQRAFPPAQANREASALPTPNPYSSPPSSTHRSQSTATTFAASPGRYADEEAQQVTPDLLLDQGPSAEMSREEEQVMQTIYNILRQGTNESDVITRHKVKVIFQKIQNLKPKEDALEEWIREKRLLEKKIRELEIAMEEEKRDCANNSDPALKAELEDCLDENLQLREMLDSKKIELNEAQSELIQLRMDRENAETRVREMEDQLAEFQDEMRKETGSKTDLMSSQAQLMEVFQQKQKLEEMLRQRERELTALKGALKDEVANHDKDMEVLREQYNADMEKLRSNMEQVSQSQAGIEAERLRVNSSIRSLQQQLEDCRDESSHWMEQFHTTRDELRTTKQELLQAKMEKEESEEEVKELQEKVSSMKKKIPDPSQAHTLKQEKEQSSADLQKTKLELEKQRGAFDKKVMEIIAIKKAHQNQEAELKYEIDRLKGQLQRTKEDFAKVTEKNKKLPDPTVITELEHKLEETRKEGGQIKEKLSSAEEELESCKTRLSRAQMEVKSLQEAQQGQEEANARLKEKLSRLETQLEAKSTESSEAEIALHTEMRALRSDLDESKRKVSRLSQENCQLNAHLDASEREKETIKETISQLDEAKRQQERALEKLNKEHESLCASSREELQALRVQMEDQRDRARKEIQEAQRHGNQAQSELDHNHMNLRRLEEEISRQKKELMVTCEERDNHQLDKELLTNRLRHLEGEIEASKNSYNEKTREIRILEDKLKRAELELEEERSSLEILTERMTRSRDQIDQLRSELMQERSSKQDLELDKNAMERQLKELRSRLADMEGQSRSSAGVAQLENKIQDLEDRLRSEEREKNSVLASQRRLERKLKELNMAMEEERETHTEQRDQLALRVKALKRQVDERETELERIEGLRRKAQRDMEEHMELKEALQARVTALETELKRKAPLAIRPTLDSSALSSDDDSFYDPSSITSILTESNLQTSSC